MLYRDVDMEVKWKSYVARWKIPLLVAFMATVTNNDMHKSHGNSFCSQMCYWTMFDSNLIFRRLPSLNTAFDWFKLEWAWNDKINCRIEINRSLAKKSNLDATKRRLEFLKPTKKISTKLQFSIFLKIRQKDRIRITVECILTFHCVGDNST